MYILFSSIWTFHFLNSLHLVPCIIQVLCQTTKQLTLRYPFDWSMSTGLSVLILMFNYGTTVMDGTVTNKYI